MSENPNRRLAELAKAGKLKGRIIYEAWFRGRYQAVIVPKEEPGTEFRRIVWETL